MKNKPNQKTLTVGTLTFEPLASGKIRVSVGAKRTDVDYKDLWSIIFLLGNEEQKDTLMPARKTPMMVFSRKYTIEAKNDIKKGDKINFWAEINVEQTVVNAIAEKNGAKVIEQTSKGVSAEELSTLLDIPSTPMQVEKGVE